MKLLLLRWIPMTLSGYKNIVLQHYSQTRIKSHLRSVDIRYSDNILFSTEIKTFELILSSILYKSKIMSILKYKG